MRVKLINALSFGAMGALLATLEATWNTHSFWLAMVILGVVQINCLLSDEY